MQLLLRWVLGAIALYVTILIARPLGIHMWIAPGVRGAEAAVIFVLILGILNAVVRPIVSLLTLPLTCLTFGLFSFVINALMFWIAGIISPDFHERGLLAPLFGSIVMTIVSGVLNSLVISDKDRNKTR